MSTLIIKELADFRKDVGRDLIADGLSRPIALSDRDLLHRLVEYGNTYLERAKKDPTNADSVIWFDIYFGDPAVVGMTWAYNPMKPEDASTDMDFFWRIWSETDPEVAPLPWVQEQFSSYCVQHAVEMISSQG